MLLGAVDLLSLRKRKCFQVKGRKHLLSPTHFLNSRLLSSGPAPSASDPGAPRPKLCIKKEHVPCVEDPMRIMQGGQQTHQVSCRLSYWAVIRHHFPQALGVQACQKDYPLLFLSPANEDTLTAGPSGRPSSHTDCWPTELEIHREGRGEPWQGQMG